MRPYLTALGLVAGICFAFGILYLFVGLRRKYDRKLNLIFALFALSYAAAVLAAMGNYSATSIAEWLSSARWDGVFVVSTWLLLIWYVAIYTRVRPRLFLGLLAIAFISTGIAHVSRPNLIHEEIFDLAYVTLPWGEPLAYVEATDSLWSTVFLLANLVAIGFILVACFIQFRRGERQPALALGAGMAWFIATILVDILVDLGIAPVYLGDFGFLGLALVMGIQMSNNAIRTEEELAHYRQNLEVMVEDRTQELHRVNAKVTQSNEQLARANEQLAREIDGRTVTEESLQRRVRELAGLKRIAHTLASVAELPVALEQVSETVAGLFEAQYVYIILPSGQEAGLQVMVGFQHGSGSVGAIPLPVSLTETPYFGQVLSRAESLTLSDVQALPLAAPMRDLIAGQGIQSAMLVPLVMRGSTIGLLAVASDDSDRIFAPDQVRLAETIASDVAGTIENARLFEQAQAAAIGEERARIARDLHDAVTQTIYSATLIAEALPRVWERNPAEGERNLVKLRQLVRGALAEMRTLLFELRPTALEAVDLSALLHYLGDALAGRTRIPVEVVAEETAEGEIVLPPDVKVALYRITQEAFNNITKHARATQVAVTLHQGQERIILEIRDNGRGFDPDSVSDARLGLCIMRERAEAIAAELAVESEIGKGTKVRVEWRRDDRRRTTDDGLGRSS